MLFTMNMSPSFRLNEPLYVRKVMFCKVLPPLLFKGLKKNELSLNSKIHLQLANIFF